MDGAMDAATYNDPENHRLDNKAVLAKWNYTENSCFACQKKNSQCDGKLMQCAMCKKAYFCSVSCANKKLKEHQKFCKRAMPL